MGCIYCRVASVVLKIVRMNEPLNIVGCVISRFPTQKISQTNKLLRIVARVIVLLVLLGVMGSKDSYHG